MKQFTASDPLTLPFTIDGDVIELVDKRGSILGVFTPSENTRRSANLAENPDWEALKQELSHADFQRLLYNWHGMRCSAEELLELANEIREHPPSTTLKDIWESLGVR